MAREHVVQLNIRVPADLHDALRDIAQREERSLVATVRRALRDYVKEHDAQG